MYPVTPETRTRFGPGGLSRVGCASEVPVRSAAVMPGLSASSRKIPQLALLQGFVLMPLDASPPAPVASPPPGTPPGHPSGRAYPAQTISRLAAASRIRRLASLPRRTMSSTAPRPRSLPKATRSASCISAARTSTCRPALDPHDPQVYAKGKENLDRFLEGGCLRAGNCARRCTSMNSRLTGPHQVGVVGCVHVDDYETDVIRKHEKTRPDKEDDRTRHVLTLGRSTPSRSS